jgi:hypothetical protein
MMSCDLWLRPRVTCAALSLLIFGCLAVGVPKAQASSERKEVSVFDFVQMIGVGVHLRYTDTAYANVRNVMDDMKFLGINHARDDLPGTDNHESLYARDMIKRIAFEGIKFDLCFPIGWQEAGAVSFVKILEQIVPGSVAFVEGFNEINNNPGSFKGPGGVAIAAAGQKAIYDAIKSDPVLQHIPVIDMTGFVELKDPTFAYGGSLKGYADLMNNHVYAQNGEQPARRSITTDKLGPYKAMEEPMPKAITEFGYSSLPQSGWLVIGVDERTQAKGIVNGLFDAARSGYDKVYIYELLDQKPDPDSKELEFHFGLFTVDNRPKASALALHNLTQVLHDTSNPDAARKMTGQLVRAEAPDSKEPVFTLTLNKSDGTNLAAIWREPPFWDRANGRPFEPKSVRANVSFEGACSSIRQYDILKSAAPVAISAGNAISLDLEDYVQLVECAK